MTREEMHAIPALYRQQKRNIERLEYLREKSLALPSFSDEPKVVKSQSTLFNAISDEIVDLENIIADGWDELHIQQTRARMTIDLFDGVLTDTEYKILMRRYVELYTFQSIADVMGYSERHIIRIHNAALKKIYGNQNLS